jgi:hydroxysqualene synthase
VKHYENFPVASWLCPPHLRAPIMAIYVFARVGDDLADEGEEDAQTRLSRLEAYRQELRTCTQAQATPHPEWGELFKNLGEQIKAFDLPLDPLHHLLDAFEQDVRYTQMAKHYETRSELLAYCSKSANPIGRLLMHLYGISEGDSLWRSDAICTSLQLINFWQDLSIDIPRRRHYLPLDSNLESELNFAHALMIQGSPLAERVPGRAGWEIRMVIQGGLRVLQKCRSTNTLLKRPRLGPWDVPVMLFKSLFMT